VEDWTLREATGADAPAIVAVVHAAFAEYRDKLDPPSSAHNETVETIRAKLAAGRALLAAAAGAPVGCVFYEPEEDHVYLYRLAVVPAYRRRGLGQALIARVEGRARELRLPRIRLGVRSALARQQAYYQRLGYRPVEARAHPGYAEPTYLILEKTLAERERLSGV
jgi:ribosomal protein S18 acetylase RimI-like enzyme